MSVEEWGFALFKTGNEFHKALILKYAHYIVTEAPDERLFWRAEK